MREKIKQLIEEHTLDRAVTEILKLSFNLPVISRYSVSLVYRKEFFNSSAIQVDTAIRVLITDADNENEALGKAIKKFEAEMMGFGLTMKVVLPIQNNGG